MAWSERVAGLIPALVALLGAKSLSPAAAVEIRCPVGADIVAMVERGVHGTSSGSARLSGTGSLVPTHEIACIVASTWS